MAKTDFFIFCGIKAQIFGDKKYIVSVPYLTVFGFLEYNSWRIFKSYGIVSLTLTSSPNIVEDSLYIYTYKFQLLSFGQFFDES